MMKKVKALLVALLVTFMALPANAQFKFGIEGGLNASKAKVDHFNAKNRTGWFIGPKAQFTVPMLGLGIDAAILYSQKYLELEASDSFDEGYEEAHFSKKLPYLEIPINLKYNIGFSSLIGMYIATGPQYSWYLGGKHLSYQEHRFGSLNTSNFSWNVGLGLNALKHLQLGVTYNIALGKTGEVDGFIDATRRMKLKNNTWQVRLAYMF